MVKLICPHGSEWDGVFWSNVRPIEDEPFVLICDWCNGQWVDYNLYDLHFSDLTHANPNHPYLNPARNNG